MKKIVLICETGMSTSLLVAKMREAARKEKLDIQIDAYPMARQQEAVRDADLVLIGPQSRFNIRKLKQEHPGIQMEKIDSKIFSSLDGEALLQFSEQELHIADEPSSK